MSYLPTATSLEVITGASDTTAVTPLGLLTGKYMRIIPNYDAANNTPALAAMLAGNMYRCSVAGTQSLNGTLKFINVDNLIIYDGVSYLLIKSSMTETVQMLAYNATTNTPALATIVNNTILRVSASGTQTVNSLSYYLNAGDLIIKDDSGLSVILCNRSGTIINSLSTQAVPYNASNDTPALANLPNGYFARVNTAGTVLINSISYSLKVGDFVYKDSSGYSMFQNNANGIIPGSQVCYITPYNALTNTPTSTSIPINSLMTVTDAGTQNLGGITYDLFVGDLIVKNVISYTVITPVKFATISELQALSVYNRVISPGTLGQLNASTTQRGIAELATDVEAQLMTDNTKAITPSNLGVLVASSVQKGLVALASDTESQAMTNATRALTPSSLKCTIGPTRTALPLSSLGFDLISPNKTSVTSSLYNSLNGSTNYLTCGMRVNDTAANAYAVSNVIFSSDGTNYYPAFASRAATNTYYTQVYGQGPNPGNTAYNKAYIHTRAADSTNQLISLSENYIDVNNTPVSTMFTTSNGGSVLSGIFCKPGIRPQVYNPANGSTNSDSIAIINDLYKVLNTGYATGTRPVAQFNNSGLATLADIAGISTGLPLGWTVNITQANTTTTTHVQFVAPQAGLIFCIGITNYGGQASPASLSRLSINGIEQALDNTSTTRVLTSTYFVSNGVYYDIAHQAAANTAFANKLTVIFIPN